MRKHSILDPLMARSTQDILVAVLMEREESWYQSDLAKRLRRTPSTLQRPLEALVQAGILRRWTEGNRVYFAAHPDCPILPELRGILAKTVGLVDVLRGELRPHFKKLRVAFVYGSVARAQQRSESDVDLLAVGAATLADLTPALANAEERLGRPVNATLFPPDEFAHKISRKNHFLQTVLADEKIFVVGTSHDLEELARPRTDRKTRHEQGRT